MDSDKFRSVHEFWGGMRHIPQPSQLLVTKEGGREAFINEERENVRGMILSRFPVILEWSYPGMAVIYEFEKKDLGGEELNELYENFCVDVVGEKYPSVLGFRLLDRSKKGNASHRFEFWCGKEDDALLKLTNDNGGTVKNV